MKKFLEVKDVSDKNLKILSDIGWIKINKIGKTIPYKKWIVETKLRKLECADNHILINNKREEVFVKDLKIGDIVITVKGEECISYIQETNETESMYDLELDHDHHLYYSNGFLSHNTLFLTHFASSFIQDGRNVVLVSAEMGEDRMVQRIDANVLDISIDKLTASLNKDDYFNRVKKVNKKKGRLFVKEYPPGYAHKNHILNYLKELKIKKGFKADIILLDYLNIFASARLHSSNMNDSYKYMKAVAEEMRAIAVEEDICLITATQVNRSSFDKGADNMDMTATSDSFGVPATADCMIAIMQPDELVSLDKYILKTIKTRYANNNNTVRTIGVDKTKMRLKNLDTAQQAIPIAVRDKLIQSETMNKILNEGKDEDEKVFIFE